MFFSLIMLPRCNYFVVQCKEQFTIPSKGYRMLMKIKVLKIASHSHALQDNLDSKAKWSSLS